MLTLVRKSEAATRWHCVTGWLIVLLAVLTNVHVLVPLFDHRSDKGRAIGTFFAFLVLLFVQGLFGLTFWFETVLRGPTAAAIPKLFSTRKRVVHCVLVGVIATVISVLFFIRWFPMPLYSVVLCMLYSLVSNGLGFAMLPPPLRTLDTVKGMMRLLPINVQWLCSMLFLFLFVASTDVAANIATMILCVRIAVSWLERA